MSQDNNPFNNRFIGSLDAFQKAVDVERAREDKIRQQNQAEFLTNLNQAIQANSSRNVGDIVGDTAIGLGKAVVRAGEFAYNIADLATGILPGDRTLNDFVGLDENFRQTNEILNSGRSDTLKAQEAEFNKAMAEYRAKAGTPTGITGVVKESAEAVKQAFSNPAFLIDMALESADSLLGASAAGKLAISQASNSYVKKQLRGELNKPELTNAKDLAKKKFNAFSQTKEGQKYLSKAGETGAVAFTGLSEGVSNAVEAHQMIMSADPAQLKKDSPKFNELLKEGKTEEEAKRILADEAYAQVFLQTGLGSAAISKFTGAGRFEGNLFSKTGETTIGKAMNSIIKSGTVQGVIRPAVAGAKEFVEEYGQSGLGALSQNLAKQEFIDPDTDVLESVGQAAGQGAAAGLTTGAPVSLISDNPLKGALKDSQKALERFNKRGGFEDYAPEVKEQLENDDLSFKDPSNTEKYNPLDASIHTIKEAQQAEGEERAQKLADAEAHLKNLGLQFKAIQEKVNSGEIKVEGKQRDKLMRQYTRMQNTRTLLDSALKHQNELKSQAATDLIDSIAEGNQTEEEFADQVKLVLGSMPATGDKTERVSDETLDKIENSDKASAAVKQQVKQYRQSVTTIEKVQDDILKGSLRWRGIKTYQERYQTAKDSGNGGFKSATTHFNNLVRFTNVHGTKLANFKKRHDLFKKYGTDLTKMTDEEANFVEWFESAYSTNYNPNGAAKLIPQMQLEVNALIKASQEMALDYVATYPTQTANMDPDLISGTVTSNSTVDIEQDADAIADVKGPTIEETPGVVEPIQVQEVNPEQLQLFDETAETFAEQEINEDFVPEQQELELNDPKIVNTPVKSFIKKDQNRLEKAEKRLARRKKAVETGDLSELSQTEQNTLSAVGKQKFVQDAEFQVNQAKASLEGTIKRENFEKEISTDELADKEYIVKPGSSRFPTQQQMDEADKKTPVNFYEPAKGTSRVDRMQAAMKRVGWENIIQGKDLYGNWYWRVKPTALRKYEEENNLKATTTTATETAPEIVEEPPLDGLELPPEEEINDEPTPDDLEQPTTDRPPERKTTGQTESKVQTKEKTKSEPKESAVKENKPTDTKPEAEPQGEVSEKTTKETKLSPAKQKIKDAIGEGITKPEEIDAFLQTIIDLAPAGLKTLYQNIFNKFGRGQLKEIKFVERVVINGKEYAGKYQPETQTIELSNDGLGAIAFHEYIHAITSNIMLDILQSPSQYTKEQKAARQQISLLYNRSKKLWNALPKDDPRKQQLDYMHKDIDEFVAEAFSLGAAMTWLSEMPDAESKSAWQTFAELLADLFGLSDQRNEFINLLNQMDIMVNGKEPSSSAKTETQTEEEADPEYKYDPAEAEFEQTLARTTDALVEFNEAFSEAVTDSIKELNKLLNGRKSAKKIMEFLQNDIVFAPVTVELMDYYNNESPTAEQIREDLNRVIRDLKNTKILQGTMTGNITLGSKTLTAATSKKGETYERFNAVKTWFKPKVSAVASTLNQIPRMFTAANNVSKELLEFLGVSKNNKLAVSLVDYKNDYEEKFINSLLKIIKAPTALQKNFDNPDTMVDFFSHFAIADLPEGQPLTRDNIFDYFDENFIRALSVNSYKYLINAADKRYLDDNNIKRNFSISQSQSVSIPLSVSNAMYNKGMLNTIEAASIGQSVMQEIGLIVDKKVAPTHARYYLENILGGTVLDTLHDMDLIDINYIDQKTFKEYRNEIIGSSSAETIGKDRNTQLTFVRIKTHKDRFGEKLDQNIIAYLNFAKNFVNKKGENFLDVLSSDGNKTKRNVSFTQNRNVVNRVKKTGQRLHPKVMEALRGFNAVQHRQNKFMSDVFDFLGEDAIKEIDGYVSDEFIKQSHAEAEGALKGKNQAIDNAVKNWKELNKILQERAEEGESIFDVDFYFDNVIDSNQRIGVAQNTVNRLQNKFHRHMIVPVGLLQTFNTKEESQIHDDFLRAILSSFKYSPDGINRVVQEDLSGNKSFADVQKLLDEVLDQDPSIRLALKALQEMHSKSRESTAEEKANIVKAVKILGEEYKSLHALSDYARYLNSNGEFTATVEFEVDGKTNGLAFSALQFGGGIDITTLIKYLNSMGMYQERFGEDQDIKHFADYNGDDMYVRLQKEWVIAAEYIRSNLLVAADVSAEADFTNKFNKFTKTLTYANGGLTVGGKAMKTFLENQYERIEKLAEKNNDPEAVFTEVNNDVALLFSYMKTLFGKEIDRKLAKNPLMIKNYQAGNKSILRALMRDVLNDFIGNLSNMMSDNFTESEKEKFIQKYGELDELMVYMEKIGMPIQMTRADRKPFFQQGKNKIYDLPFSIFEKTKEGKVALNEAGEVTLRPIIKNGGFNLLRQITLTPESYLHLETLLNATYGAALEQAFIGDQTKMQDNRAELTDALTHAFHMWHLLYQAKVEATEKEKKRALTVAELEAIDKELQKYKPVIDNYWSVDVDTQQFGMPMLDQEKNPLSIGGKIASVKFDRNNFGKTFNYFPNPLEDAVVINKRKRSSMTVHANEFAPVGVWSGLSVNIAAESATQILSALAMLEQTGDPNQLFTNVHDASIFNISNVTQGAQNQNTAFMTVNQNYRMVDVVSKRYQEIIAEINKFDDSNEIKNRAIREMTSEIKSDFYRQRRTAQIRKALFSIERGASSKKAADSYKAIFDEANLQYINQYGRHDGWIRVDSIQNNAEFKQERKEEKKERFQSEQVKPVIENIKQALYNLVVSDKSEFNNAERSHAARAIELLTFLLDKGYFEKIRTAAGVGRKIKETFKNPQQYLGDYIAKLDQKKPKRLKLENLLSNDFQKELNKIIDAAIKDDANTLKLGSSVDSKGFDPETFIADESITLSEGNILNTLDHLFKLYDEGTSTQISGKHMAYLRDMAKDIGGKIVDPLQLAIRKQIANEKNANTNWGILDQANSTIYINGASKSRIKGIGAPMSAAETLIHELVHAVTGMSILKDSPHQNRLQELYEYMIENSTYELFMPVGMKEGDLGYEKAKEIAEEQWSYVFGENAETSVIEYTNSVSKETYEITVDHGIQEFMAFAIANENFRANLAKLDTAPNKDVIAENWLDVVTNLFTRMMNWIRGIGNTTNDKKMLAEMDHLYHLLGGATHEAETQVTKTLHRMERMYQGLLNGVQFVVNPVAKGVGKVLSKSKDNIVGAIGDALEDPDTFIAGLDRTLKTIDELIDSKDFDREGFLPSTLHEIRGTHPLRYFLVQANRKTKATIDTLRRNLRVAASKASLEAFAAPENKNLSKADKQALGQLLRVDTTYLLNGETVNKYDSKTIAELLSDPTKLNAYMTKVKRTITQEFKANSFYYSNMAENLGQYMYSHTSRYADVRLNAATIARMYGTSLPAKGDLNRAENLIDELASLAGLQAMQASEKKRVVEIITAEVNNNKKDNGLTFMLSMHNRLKRESLNSLFDGNPVQMMKGYTRQITDPNVQFKVVTEQDGEKLVKMGYVKSHLIPRDPTDPLYGKKDAPDLYLYHSRADTDNGYQGQALSYTDGNTAGTDLLRSFTQINHPSSAKSARLAFGHIKKSKQTIADGIANNDPKALQAPKGDNVLVPVFDENGQITNYRYMMKEQNKLRILKKDTSFDAVLGATAGNIKDKYHSNKLNQELLGKLHQHYLAEYQKNPKSFVSIRPNSSKRNHREIWRMLPEKTKAMAKELWGKDEIIVPADEVPLIFGQRTPSVANLEHTDLSPLEGRDRMRAAAYNTMVSLLNNYPVRVAEGYTKAFIKVAKDTIVIKSGVTMLFNILSNMYLLRSYGIPLEDIIKGHMLVFKKGSEHHRDEMAIRDLTYQLENSPSAAKKNIKRKIAALENRMVVNPVSELIDAYTYQSIVEDIDNDDDQYGYKGRIEHFFRKNQHVDGILNKIPEQVKRFGEYAVMAHNTPIYQALKDMTQLSDFAGRYILHQHLVKKGFHPSFAHKIIMDTFVDYDVPTHRFWQYGNEMGFTIFTKFFFRIQRTNWRLLTGIKQNVEDVAELQQELKRKVAEWSKKYPPKEVELRVARFKKSKRVNLETLPNVIALLSLEGLTGIDAASTFDENITDALTRVSNPIELADVPVTELGTVKLSPF